MHLNHRFSVHCKDHYRHNHTEKMLPMFKDMVDVSATFLVCRFSCGKLNMSFDVFSDKCVSDLASGK